MESDKHVQDLMRSITASLAIFKRFLLTRIRPFSQGENFTDWCNSVLNPYCNAHVTRAGMCRQVLKSDGFQFAFLCSFFSYPILFNDPFEVSRHPDSDRG